MRDPARDVGERLVELESKLSFQEHTIDSLSEVVADQATALEALERRLTRLEGRLGEGGEEEGEPLEERPPHY